MRVLAFQVGGFSARDVTVRKRLARTEGGMSDTHRDIMDGDVANGDVVERLKGAAPAGAAGLAIVAGLVAWSLTSNAPPSSAPDSVSSSESSSIPPAAAAPVETASTSPAQPGAPLPGVAFDQAPATSPPAMGMEIVVKFKDDAKVKDMIDAFWRDPAAAKQRFEAFKSGKPEFSDLKLDRVTYSNELVLIDAQGGAARLPAMREIAARLNSLPDVSYAEPNMTAQPGTRTP
jgi:hypothetical protein